MWKSVIQVHQKFDPDGAISLMKWPLDWLVHAGVLVNDTEAYLRPHGWPVKQIVSRVPGRSIVLVLWPKPSDADWKAYENGPGITDILCQDKQAY
jgi:hypothetical protein